MALTDELPKDAKQELEIYLKLWNETLINDFDDWVEYNQNKGIDLISDQNNPDPLHGIDL